MLFHSSLRKELARSFGGTFVVLITVVMTMMLIRTLGQASKGSVNPQDVMLIMGYSVVGHLPTILTLSLFISIVGTLSRLYKDSEMVIWLTSGLGLMGFIRPIFRFSWPVMLLVIVLSLGVWPWTNQKTQELKEIYSNRGDLERVTPGQFQESSGGKRVFFVEKDADHDKTGKNVFVSTTDGTRHTITSARMGQVQVINNERFLILTNGQRYERSSTSENLRISEFVDYGIKIGDGQALDNNKPAYKTLPTLKLLQDKKPAAQAELAWRIGLAFAVANLSLLALAITSANPRVGKSNHFLLALFTFVVYYNLINLSQNWIGSGRHDFLVVIFLVHGGLFVSACGWVWLRHSQRHWSDLFRISRRTKVASSVP
jgi:lipopolysaccharide export system permease protein